MATMRALAASSGLRRNSAPMFPVGAMATIHTGSSGDAARSSFSRAAMPSSSTSPG